MKVQRNPIQLAMLLAGVLSSGTGAYAADSAVAATHVSAPPVSGAQEMPAPAAAAPTVPGGAAAVTAPGAAEDAPAVTAGYPAVSSHYVTRITQNYGLLFGSAASVESLVGGLRNGTPITLSAGTGGVGSVTFTSPAGRMGYGNVTQTLSLVARQLTMAGIPEPTPEQLHAALMGGTVGGGSGEAVTMAGVLRLRSQGMGWDKIAQTIGVQPGAARAGSLVARNDAADFDGSEHSYRSGLSPAAGPAAGSGIVLGRGGAGLRSGLAGRGLAFGSFK